MPLRTLLLAAALALPLTGGAVAATVLDGSSADAILNVARGYGGATLESQDSGDPRISGRINGVPYQVFFLNCTDHTACQDLNFYAGFTDVKPTLDAINAWNRDKRFGNAYLDSALDAAVEYDVNVQYGVTAENLDSDFGLWALILGEFSSYVSDPGPPIP